MLPSERDMLQPPPPSPSPDRFTSLQPTYEDSVAPDPDEDWDTHDHS